MTGRGPGFLGSGSRCGNGRSSVLSRMKTIGDSCRLIRRKRELTSAPGMRVSGWGRVVNMAAGSAFIRNHGVYGLAKAAVITLTEELVDVLRRRTQRPHVLISGSAIGWYGDQGATLLEEDAAAHDEYMHRLCRKGGGRFSSVATGCRGSRSNWS